MAVGVGGKMATGGYATTKALYPWVCMTLSYILMHWSPGRTNFFRAWDSVMQCFPFCDTIFFRAPAAPPSATIAPAASVRPQPPPQPPPASTCTPRLEWPPLPV